MTFLISNYSFFVTKNLEICSETLISNFQSALSFDVLDMGAGNLAMTIFIHHHF
ncbi:MAG: hypothetical protein ACK5ZX_00280 [Bacteroidota bacterium]